MSELVLCGETDIAAADIRISINQMKRNITGETITGFEKQFQVLITKFTKYTISEFFWKLHIHSILFLLPLPLPPSLLQHILFLILSPSLLPSLFPLSFRF